MDAYPPQYIAHNLPLIALSGLTSSDDDPSLSQGSNGPVVKAQSPTVKDERGKELLHDFELATGDDHNWSGSGTRESPPVFKYKFSLVGRVSDYIILSSSLSILM